MILFTVGILSSSITTPLQEARLVESVIANVFKDQTVGLAAVLVKVLANLADVGLGKVVAFERFANLGETGDLIGS